MPIEIKELIVTAQVEAGDRKSSGSNVPPADMKAIVKRCVEEVMDILKEKQER